MPHALIENSAGQLISPFHDVPLYADAEVSRAAVVRLP